MLPTASPWPNGPSTSASSSMTVEQGMVALAWGRWDDAISRRSG